MALPNIIQQINSKLPLSGGTMTGVITRSGYLARSGNESNILAMISGTDVKHGAGLWLAGNSYSGSVPAGAFRLQCYNPTTQVYTSLTGTNTGSLTWNGGEVITSKGGEGTGTLYTKGNIPYELRHTTASNGDTTRETATYQMLCVGLDKNGKRGGGVEIAYGTGGTRTINFTMRNRADSGWVSAGLVENADGSSQFNVNGQRTVTITTYYRSGASWYRKYSDGFIEQGGNFTNSARGTTITFPLAFTSTNYQALACINHADNGWTATTTACVRARTTSNMVVQIYYNSSNTAGLNSWYACGY